MERVVLLSIFVLLLAHVCWAFPGNCSRLNACASEMQPRGLQSYDECKRKMNALFSTQASCVRKAIQDSIKDKQCQCTPSDVFLYSGLLTPSASKLAVLHHCSDDNDTDALLPGCPAAVTTDCEGLEPYLEGLSFNGSCSNRQRQLLKQAEKCDRVLQTSDISKCGSIQDLFNYIKPLIQLSKSIVCSGCDLNSFAENCTPKQTLSSDAHSYCNLNDATDTMMTCMVTTAKQEESCSSVASDIDSFMETMRQTILLKPLSEGCDVEKQFNYQQEYDGWGCSSVQGKGSKDDTPVKNRVRRSSGDTLRQLLWSAFTQLYH